MKYPLASIVLVTSTLVLVLTNFIPHLQAAVDITPPDGRATFIDTDQDTPEGGFVIDEHMLDIIEDEQRAREETKKSLLRDREAKHSSKPQLFDSICPYGFFTCQNGECLSPRWRCDGHYDCDDLSDERNCNNSSSSPVTDATTPKPTDKTTSKPAHQPEDVTEIKFNSMQEPMMLFSTGVSIRGYWMRSRIYFDVFSKTTKPRSDNPTITQALSIFFDLLNGERTTPSPATDETSGKTRSTIVGVDMDPNDKEVFWVELGKDPGVYSTVIDSEQFESRYRRQLSPPLRTVIDSGLLSPEDVALDHASKNIYITDAGLPAIVVCSVKHSHCKVIVSTDLHKPRALIIDSSTGWLTYTDWGDHPGIYLASMDGTKRDTLINTDVVWPNGLAADYQENQLYWADARLNKIERVDLVTKKRKVLVKEDGTNPFSLSMFENRVYWSDWSGSDIRTCDKLTGNDTKMIMRTDNIYGIHIYHPANYPKSSEQENPCWSLRCSHLCLLTPTVASYEKRKEGHVTAQCACPESMALSSDKATCYEVQLSFVMLNVKNYIAQVFPERIGLHTVEKIIHSKDHIIHDVAADWTHYRIFFYDLSKEHIYFLDMANRNSKIEQFLPEALAVRSLMYDSWSDNLYWLDTEQGIMTMCSVKGKVQTELRRDLDKPVSLALDSKRRVFYIALMGAISTIMRTDILATKQSDQTVVSTDLGVPVALHLDEQAQRLYWADYLRETIESVDLDADSNRGAKVGSRHVHRRRLGAVLAFAVYNDYFLWTIKNGDYLYKAKIAPVAGSAATRFKPLAANDNSRPIGLKLPRAGPSSRPSSSSEGEGVGEAKRLILVDPTKEAVDSACDKLGCSHGCVLDSDMKASCICPASLKLQPTKYINCYDETVAEGLASPIPPENGMVWLIVLLLLLSLSGLIVVIGLLVMYRQGKLPRQVSQLSVSFSPSSHDKDGAMLLLDNDT